MLNGRTAIFSSLVAIVVGGCASFKQTSHEVYRREGAGLLKPWKTVPEAAQLHWPYAWASVSAYLHEADGKKIEVTEACPEPHAFLSTRGWVLWEELPRVGRKSQVKNDLEKRLQDAHLRVEVWSNQSVNTVIVAFGGTASFKDISSNARWVLPFTNRDAYDVLTDSYVPEYIAVYKKRASQQGGAWLKSARVVSTGHSLGGGLAQRFAYSLDPSDDIPGVSEVYGFNPSPVSGKRGVAGFKDRAKGLQIYRIYNRGEILATVRSTLQWANPGNARNDGQIWVDLRYAHGWNLGTLMPYGWVKAHGMRDLACFMSENL